MKVTFEPLWIVFVTDDEDIVLKKVATRLVREHARTHSTTILLPSSAHKDCHLFHELAGAINHGEEVLGNAEDPEPEDGQRYRFPESVMRLLMESLAKYDTPDTRRLYSGFAAAMKLAPAATTK